MIAFGLVLGVIWTVIAVGVYRSYTRALADEMRRRSLVARRASTVAEDDAALRALLRSDDARDVRLGLDLLAGVASRAPASELRQCRANTPIPRCACGRSSSSRPSGDPGARRGAARARRRPRPLRRTGRPARGRDRARLSRRPRRRRRMLVALLDDRDPTVRAAALDAVVPEDAPRAGGRPSRRRSGRGAAHVRQRDRRTPNGSATRRFRSSALRSPGDGSRRGHPSARCGRAARRRTAWRHRAGAR